MLHAVSKPTYIHRIIYDYVNIVLYVVIKLDTSVDAEMLFYSDSVPPCVL